MRRFIVTGGLGFIGSNLIELLISKGHMVLNLDKVSYASNYYNVKSITKNKKYEKKKPRFTNPTRIDILPMSTRIR